MKIMKKVIALLLLIISTVILTSCGKSEAVKEVEAQIANIGTVTKGSGVAISAAETAYNKLTTEEKQKVSNYDILQNARAIFNAFPKEINLTANNIEKYLNFEVEYEYTNHKSRAIAHIEASPKRPGKFSDVCAKVELELWEFGGWTVSYGDPSYNADDKYTAILKINISPDGSGKGEVAISNGYNVLDSDALTFLHFKDVSGVFIEQK